MKGERYVKRKKVGKPMKRRESNKIKSRKLFEQGKTWARSRPIGPGGRGTLGEKGEK